jgi:2-amino-4-hydroxy-6-hydroxymethyldihydropteridine diphosphokinase
VNSIYLLLGGNQGDRQHTLAQARVLLQMQLGNIAAVSPLYETAAWGKTNQPHFLNQAVKANTCLSALECLTEINAIETQLGRQRKEHWGQRTLDIDILFYNAEKIHSSRLVVPHPEIQNRRFALTPLCAIAPNLLHPILNQSVADLLLNCPDKLEVNLFESKSQL